ncbi:hypothetical protein Zm00014a_001860 [Zea mays]|uniref:DUF659 domain-containing protein n=1 Tax=Zea mays TaxID=4577 RepID=A0A3L6DD58_MAIZE|nr:hypothetical protein Zm00014a_001860 [Zea mays]
MDLAHSRAQAQPRVDIMLRCGSRDNLGKALAKWFHANDIPGRKADCPYFRSTIKLAQECGQGVHIPIGKELDDKFLDMNYEDMEAHMTKFKDDWKEYGVTVMCDSWTGPTMMCIINLWLHAMMREKIGGELIRWNATRRWWSDMELVLNAVTPIYTVLCYADQQKKNATIAGFLPKMMTAMAQIHGNLSKEKDLLDRIVGVIKKRLKYMVDDTLIVTVGALDPKTLYMTKLARKPSTRHAVTLALKKLASSSKIASAAIEQYAFFYEKRGLFVEEEAKRSTTNGRTSAGNPIMDWLCNSRSESTPILDEYDDNELESPIPSRVLMDELGMDVEVTTLKRKLDFNTRDGKKKRKAGFVDIEEEIEDDVESDSLEVGDEFGDEWDFRGPSGGGACEVGASGDGSRDGEWVFHLD